MSEASKKSVETYDTKESDSCFVWTRKNKELERLITKYEREKKEKGFKL